MAGLKQLMEIFRGINQPLSSEQRVRWYKQRIRAADLHDSPPPQNFLKPVCGISVVKRKITPVFTEVIFLLVDLKGIEPSNLTDANRALSQLSYRPKSALFMRKKLRILDFSNIRFSGESPTNRTGKRETENRGGCVSLWMRTVRSPTELQAQIE